MWKLFLALVSGMLLVGSVQAQQVEPQPRPLTRDSANAATFAAVNRVRPATRMVLRGLVVPAALVAAGALTTEHVEVINSDEAMREESREHLSWVRTNADDQLRHVPAYATLGLSLIGVKGKHSTVNQAFLFALTYTINNTLTSNLKRLTRVERPQGNSFDSFPSQHTSAAFSAARFLDREYGERSVWYSVGGYTVATGVATLRVVKDNHWVSDVLAGAGVGMLSTELAYWMYPYLRRLLIKGLQDRAMILPYYQSGSTGLTVALVL